MRRRFRLILAFTYLFLARVTLRQVASPSVSRSSLMPPHFSLRSRTQLCFTTTPFCSAFCSLRYYRSSNFTLIVLTSFHSTVPCAIALGYMLFYVTAPCSDLFRCVTLRYITSSYIPSLHLTLPCVTLWRCFTLHYDTQFTLNSLTLPHIFSRCLKLPYANLQNVAT